MNFNNVIRIIGNCLAVLCLIIAIAIMITKATMEVNYISGITLSLALALSCWQPKNKNKFNSSTYQTWTNDNIDNPNRIHKQEWINDETISICVYDKKTNEGVEAIFKMVSCKKKAF